MATQIGLTRCLCSVLLVFLCGGSGQPGLVKLPASPQDGILLDRAESRLDADEMPANEEPTDLDDFSTSGNDNDDVSSVDDEPRFPTRNQGVSIRNEARTKQTSSVAKPRKVRRVCRVTAYCDRGLTASGIPSGVGQCAAPADIPLGSVVYIPELNKHFVVTDRTHRRFRHNTVDLFIPNEGDCIKFGRKYLTCEFVIPENPPAYGKLNLAAARRAAIALD
jgi:3D (Asp-Asp-Asp) domain-containing protein